MELPGFNVRVKLSTHELRRIRDEIRSLPPCTR